MLLQHSHTTISATSAKLRQHLFLSRHIKQKTNSDGKFKFNNNNSFHSLGDQKQSISLWHPASQRAVLSCSVAVQQSSKCAKFCFVLSALLA